MSSFCDLVAAATPNTLKGVGLRNGNASNDNKRAIQYFLKR
jgi:hypothetical protein